MSKGVARKVDQLGRVVLPVEMRKALGIELGDLVMMSEETGQIVLEKVEQHCVFCRGTDQLRDYSRTLVCAVCVERVSQL